MIAIASNPWRLPAWLTGRLKKFWRAPLAMLMSLPMAKGGLPYSHGGLPANDGDNCCMLALVPCTSGTTLYTTPAHATAGTTVLYSGACYSVQSTTHCTGSVVTGPFTVVTGCSDASCTGGGPGGGPAPCSPYYTGTDPRCNTLSSTYAVSGWSGVFPPAVDPTTGSPECWNGIANDCCDRGGTGTDDPAWGGLISNGGSGCGFNSQLVAGIGAYCMPATDGSKLTVSAYLYCCFANPDVGVGFDTSWWVLVIQWTGCCVKYYKPGGATPAGIYHKAFGTSYDSSPDCPVGSCTNSCDYGNVGGVPSGPSTMSVA